MKNPQFLVLNSRYSRSEKGIAIAEVVILLVLTLLLVLCGIRLFGGSIFGGSIFGGSMLVTESDVGTLSETDSEPTSETVEPSTIEEGGAITKQESDIGTKTQEKAE